jgi:Tol biopolymer transport system component
MLWLVVPLLVVAFAARADGVPRAATPPIAFPTNRLDRDLVVMRANGTARRTITLSGRDDGDPSWSPDGTRVAFDYYDGRRQQLAVLELRGGRVSSVGEGSTPDWSPDGRRLVALDADNFDDLVTMNADGSGRHELGLSTAGIADETDPSWSLDGRRIAFVGDGLYVVNASGSGLHRIRREGFGGAASWSPDGRRIAFDCVARGFQSCTVRADGSRLRGLSRQGRRPSWSRQNLVATALEDGPNGLVVVHPDGRMVRRLRGSLSSPDWSPAGRHLVAAHEVATNVRLYAIDPTGRRIERLTARRGTVDQAPAWSPGGTRIVFRRRHGRRCSLAVLDLRTHRVRAIVRRTTDRYCLGRPDWSAKGRGIVYESAGDLWTVSPRGGRPRRVTSTRAREMYPRWAPDGRSIGFVAPGGIWVQRPGGSRSLLVPGGGAFAWSRDGTSLAYSVYNGATDESDLYLKTGTAPPRRLFEGIDGAPAWSPDGLRLALSHTDPDPHGQTTLFVVDLAGNAAEIAQDPAGDPDWRP